MHIFAYFTNCTYEKGEVSVSMLGGGFILFYILVDQLFAQWF
jgi:hypothetical protein